MRRVSVMADEVRAGDRLLNGERVEEVEAYAVGPEWVVAAWLRDRTRDEWGLPHVTWPDGAEVEVWRGQG